MLVKLGVGKMMNRTRLEPRSEPIPRVVIADADPDARSLYREALRRLAVEAIGAADGRDALVQCLIQRPAMVITDTWLPFIDGYALCELLRRDPLTRSVPIVVVTADVRTPALVALARLGSIAILGKPVSVDTLAEAVERVRDEPGPAPIPGELSASSDGAPKAAAPKMATRSFRRFETTAPATLPPPLRCPGCDRLLEFRKSRIGGVTRLNAEQWDEFCCPECSGTFEYRHRTKKLRVI